MRLAAWTESCIERGQNLFSFSGGCLAPNAGKMQLFQVPKSGEPDVIWSLRGCDRGLYRQGDLLIDGCEGL